MPDIIKSDQVTTIREEFSEYVLDDGNTLKLKNVLISIGRTSETKIENNKTKVKALFQLHTVTGVIPTGKVDVAKLLLQEKPDVSINERVSKIGFILKKGMLNLYETEQFLIILRDSLIDVWTTNFKDVSNIPIYSIESTSTIELLPKKEIAPIK